MKVNLKTTTVFAATTPGNTLFAYRASTLTDPTPMISPAFVEANYEILESLLRDRRRQIRNEDLRTELEYFSEDYDEEREMEPRPERTREVTPPLRTRSPRVRRQRERVVGFEEAPNREGSRTGRNTEGNRPSKAGAEENGRREMNLPPLLAAHLGRNKNGQPLQSSLTSVHGGRQSSINIGGNLPPNGTLLSHHAQPFIPSSAHVPNGFVPTHVNPYSQPSTGIINGQTPSALIKVLQMEFSPLGEPFLRPLQRMGQQKRFTKTHLAVHIIKQREGESVKAFTTRYTNDTLQILGLHEDQRIFGFVHGLRTRNLVEHLSTDLSSTYKGLMERTYTWIEAKSYPLMDPENYRRDNYERSRKSAETNAWVKKVAYNSPLYMDLITIASSSLFKTPREILATEKVAKTFKQHLRLPKSKWSRDKTKYCHFYEDHGHDTNQCRELKHQIEEAVKSGQLAHLVKSIKKKKDKVSDIQLGKWKEERRNANPAKTLVLMITRRSCNPRKRYVE
ncbi:hypothetical protein Tco_0475369 [Tanacetum coccineum]